MQSLESKALSGGIILASRQLIGIVLNIIGMLVNARLLGPQKYGQLAIVIGLMSYVSNVGKGGFDVYLIRYQGELEQRTIGVTQFLYLLIGFLMLASALALGPLAAWWYKDALLRNLIWAYAIVPPLTVMSGIPIALLDRQFSYKKAAAVELLAQIVYLIISVPIIWYTRSVWGLILAGLGQAVLTLSASALLSKMYFQPAWDPHEVKIQLQYGVSYGVSFWIWQVRDLVNPLIVGKMIGTEAVAFVAIAVRLSQTIGFAKSGIWRVYMSFLGRLASDRARMKEAVEAGLSHQVLVVVVSYIGFMAVGPEIITGLMGARWLPIFDVLPFIAAGQIVNSGFSLHSSALYVIGENRDVSMFHFVHIVLFITVAWYLTNLRGDISGYGWAEVAAFPSYFLIRAALRKRLFPIVERRLFFNMGYAMVALVVLVGIIHTQLWLRLATSALLLVILLTVSPGNRQSTLMVLETLTEKLKALR
jgi:PST family polysaccharide transporter